ncbi:MAG: hypothetical protein JNK37_18430 [Verrucomicrobiales bacterium]|nr:hypothetical protein [Verrucomicrobiales bacterium]
MFEFFSEKFPRLHLVSGLAEGADALAADLFLDLKEKSKGEPVTQHSQSAVIGFPYAAYRDSRPPAHQREFDRLAQDCTHVLELDGPARPYPNADKKKDHQLDKDRRARAYRAQTELILRNSDILVAVADRSKDALAGGTLEAVRSAQGFRLPVVFVELITASKDSETKDTSATQTVLVLKAVKPTFIQPDETLEGALSADYHVEGVTESIKKKIEEWIGILVAGPAISLLRKHEGVEEPGVSSNSKVHLKKQLDYLNEYFYRREVPEVMMKKGKEDRRPSWQERFWKYFGERIEKIGPSLIGAAESVKEWGWAWKRLTIELGPDAKNRLAEFDALRRKERDRIARLSHGGSEPTPSPERANSGNSHESNRRILSNEDDRKKRLKEFEIPGVKKWRDRATALSYHYAGLYRGTIVAIYLLSVIAVALAGVSLLVLGGQGGLGDFRAAAGLHPSPTVAGAPPPSPEMGGSHGESHHSGHQNGPHLPALLVLAFLKIGCVLGILWLTTLGNSRRWNDRAINYRYLAERLRVMHIFPRLGSFQPPAAGVSQSASRAMDQGIFDWLFDAIVRSAPVKCWMVARPKSGSGSGVTIVKPTPEIAAELATLFLVDAQIDYHKGNHAKMHLMHEALEAAGKLFNIAVVAIVALDIGLIAFKLTHPPDAVAGALQTISAWLIFLAGLLPAVVAAIHGVRYQSECQRLSDRSLMMARLLDTHGDRLDNLRHLIDQHLTNPADDPGSWTAEVLHATEACARDLIEEAAEWTVLYSKEINEP